MSADGGPAFPGPNHVSEMLYDGMSLRDYFAAAALQGWLAKSITTNTDVKDCAKFAYQYADAMLEERNK